MGAIIRFAIVLCEILPEKFVIADRMSAANLLTRMSRLDWVGFFLQYE